MLKTGVSGFTAEEISSLENYAYLWKIGGLSLIHIWFPEKQPFSEMLVDLCDFLKPDLCIVDGILAMEGNGPTGGKPRKLGVLGASKSPYALDVCATSLIGIVPESILMLKEAHRLSLIHISYPRILWIDPMTKS